jgi:hypothetical protein
MRGRKSEREASNSRRKGVYEMSSFVPSAEVVLAAAIQYLQQELLPTLDGYHRFLTRVTVNVLKIVMRELLHAGAHDAAAR